LGTQQLANADRFGVYLVYASSPQGSWSWHDVVANSNVPMPCDADAAGIDYTYFEDIFAHLPTSASRHDPDQVFAYGFSQNGMGSGYVGTCFQDKVTGVWRGGAGLFIKGGASGPVPPGGEGNCADCEFWPTYPCFQGVGKRALRDCAMSYDNDRTVVQDASVGQPQALHAKGILEGNDIRALIFSPTSSIQGGHAAPQDEFDWIMGCVGLRDSAGKCSSDCEAALQSCTSSSSYAACMGISGSADAAVASACDVGCTPTWSMLSLSEVPTVLSSVANNFGAASVCHEEQPSQSSCTADGTKVRSCSDTNSEDTSTGGSEESGTSSSGTVDDSSSQDGGTSNQESSRTILLSCGDLATSFKLLLVLGHMPWIFM